MNTKNHTTILKRTGLRKTKDRLALLELFERSRTWTAAQLHEETNADLSTIYRNLQAFADVGLIKKVHSHDGEQQYEQDQSEHHDHLACSECHVTRCIPCPAPSLNQHVLELFSICNICQKTS